jgi:hypothetical protein
MPVLASLGRVGRVQNGAVAWPMGVLGGRAWLVEVGGGEWGLVAQCQLVASPRSSNATVGHSGYAGK